MSLAQSPRSHALRAARLPVAIAVLALALLAVLPGRAVAQGWLVAFVFWSGIGIGSLVLLLIHRLTGGRWGATISGATIPAALTLPIATIAFVPLIFALPGPYRWAGGAGDIPADVARYYLNQPSFLIRTFIAMTGWSALGLLFGMGRSTRLIAALGLAFYGFAISLVAVDWILSIEPHFGSSAFAAGIAFQQMLSALAFAAIVAPGQRADPNFGDLGGLLLAVLLGTVYVDLMSFIVSWYGDLPEKAEWYLRREEHGWQWVIVAAIGVGAFVPFAMLLRAGIRKNRTALRFVGTLVIVGIFLHLVWLMAPTFESAAVPAALLTVIALSCLSFALFRAIGFGIADSTHG